MLMGVINNMDNNSQRKLGALLSYASIIISTLVQLVYTPVLIRILGQSEYGLYSLVASVIGYLTILDLGFGNAIVVYTAKYRANKEYDKEKKMQGMFKIIFYIIGGVVALLGIALYFNVENIFGKTMTSQELDKAKIMMLILAFNLVITFTFNIYSSIINAYEKFTFQKVMSILNTLLKPIIMMPLLLLGYKSITMCLSITAVNIIVVLSNYIYCNKKLNININFKGFDKTLFVEMFSYSFFIFLGVIVDKVNWSVDQIILGAVSGTISISVYSIASQLNTLFINLSTAINGVLLPKMSKMIAQKATTKELTNEMIKVGRIQYYIIFLMASGFILVGKPFIIWWAGNEYEISYYVALLLIIPICFPLIQNLGISIMQAMNKHKFRAIVTAIMAIFNVGMSYFLAKAFGAIGSALGTTIALIVCNIIIINIYYKKAIGLEIGIFWKDIIKMTILFLIPVALILVIMSFTNLTGILSVVVYAVIYSIMYGGVVYYLVMNDYEKDIVNDVLKKLHLKKV